MEKIPNISNSLPAAAHAAQGQIIPADGTD